MRTRRKLLVSQSTPIVIGFRVRFDRNESRTLPYETRRLGPTNAFDDVS